MDPLSLYGVPSARAKQKILTRLDRHMRAFIAKSPFVCMGTVGDSGADVTPRGGDPGFIRVHDDATLLLPDWPGNNRLDTLRNILADGRTGLLFLIPGVGETLRVNGIAEVSTDPSLLEQWSSEKRLPKTVLKLSVREAFFHCPKALIRSRLWHEDAKIDRKSLPTYGEMLKDEVDVPESAEEIQAIVERDSRERLY